MKKTTIISILLIMTMLLSSLGIVQVHAQDEEFTVYVPNVYYDSAYDDSYYTSGLGISQSAYESLMRTVASGVLNCSASIPLTSYGITMTQAHSDCLASLVYKNDPRFFNVASFSMSYNSACITKLNVSYDHGRSEFETMLAECDETVESLVGDLRNAILPDAEKALLVHDRLAVLNEYDITYNLPNTHDMYGALVNHISVCEGYAQAYCYLLDSLGIRSYMITSDTLNHAWNIVYIDGTKYHVDVTWDDPTYDITGRVLHNNFLLSSSALYNAGSNGHVANDYDTSPVDTTYDTYYWQDSSTEFRYLNGRLYYIDEESETLSVRENGASTQLVSVSDTWRSQGGGYWLVNFSKLSGNSRYLFYSTAKKVFRYDPATGDSSVAYEPDLSSYNSFSIYGFKADSKYFYLDVYNTPNFESDTKTRYGIKYEYTDPVPVQILYGDITGDGEVNTVDSTFAFRCDAGLIYLTDEQIAAGDVDGDLEVTSMDATLILKFDAGLIDAFPVESKID
ncbi:MAG: hypothetical protein IJS94_04705 [Clostridia bacterium]|nr:hypothetical protein [Clostridia bacterium]